MGGNVGRCDLEEIWKGGREKRDNVKEKRKRKKTEKGELKLKCIRDNNKGKNGAWEVNIDIFQERKNVFHWEGKNMVFGPVYCIGPIPTWPDRTNCSLDLTIPDLIWPHVTWFDLTRLYLTLIYLIWLDLVWSACDMHSASMALYFNGAFKTWLH